MNADPADAVRASSVPGGWVAVAGRSMWVLADLDQTHEAIDVLWGLLERGADHLEVLSVLAGIGLRRIPNLALASATERGLTVVLRGSATARIGAGPEAKERTAAGVSTWVEYPCGDSVREMELIGEAAAVSEDLPLSAGVVRACRLHLRFGAEPGTGAHPLPATSRDIVSVAPRTPASVSVTPAPAAKTPVAPSEATAPEPSTPPALAQTPVPEPKLPVAAKEVPSPEAKPAGTPKEMGPSGPAAPPATPASVPHGLKPATPPSQPKLPAAVKETQPSRPAAPAAATPSANIPTRSNETSPNEPETPATTISLSTTRKFRADEEKAAPAEPGPPLSLPTPVPAPPPPPPPPPPTSGAGLIDHVPWAPPRQASRKDAPPSPPSVAAPTLAAADDESDGLTISREVQQKLLLRAAAAGELPRPGPTVHAVHCPSGHPNPAHAVQCRVCHSEIPDNAPVTVPRPVLGVLRMSTGDVITLDRGVLMGRSPSTTRLVGAERPHLVKIPSPDKDISRNHLEIRLDGWHVLVTDLKSTNGTLVTLPGREPERLRPDAPAPIEPGTTVSLADEVTFRFEVVD